MYIQSDSKLKFHLIFQSNILCGNSVLGRMYRFNGAITPGVHRYNNTKWKAKKKNDGERE